MTHLAFLSHSLALHFVALIRAYLLEHAIEPNQDAYAVSRAMGIREGRSLHYDHSPDAARETMTRVSHNVRAHRRSDLAMQADTAFFSDQFEAAGAIPYDEHKAREAAKAKPANQKDAK